MSEENSPSNDDGTNEEEFKTILYAFTREALRPQDLQEVKSALEDAGYRMAAGDSENILIQRQEETGSSMDLDSVLDS